MSTPILPFAVWEPGTNQASIPANDNALRAEILAGRVISKTTTAQPAGVNGAIYIIPAGATGSQWGGFTAGDLAIYRDGSWSAYAPVSGIMVHMTGVLQQWTGSGWVDFGGSSSGELPVNEQSGSYTLALSDANGVVYHPPGAGSQTWTVPANSAVNYPVGTAITLDNDAGAGTLSIAITSDTMVMVGTGSTGSRTLAAGGQATLLKVSATRWRISGVGLT